MLFRSNSRHLREASDPDLVLHLIGTHHGRGRALAPVSIESGSIEVHVNQDGESLSSYSAHSLEKLDSGWTERFDFLNRRYGYWGLAYLEAVFHRADCLASNDEQERIYD